MMIKYLAMTVVMNFRFNRVVINIIGETNNDKCKGAKKWPNIVC